MMSWEEKAFALKQYIDNHDGEYPSKNDNPILYYFVQNQRKVLKHGKLQKDGSLKQHTSVLTKERIKYLKSIDFRMEDEKRNSSTWNKMYNLLVEYLEEHNGEYPLQKESYKGERLGIFVAKQRTIINNGKVYEDGSIKYQGYTLTKERLELLKKIDFKLVAMDYDELWDINFNLLKEYLEEHDNYPMAKERYKGYVLRSWLSTQRTIYNNGVKDKDGNYVYMLKKLTKERIEKLNSINFVWEENPQVIKKNFYDKYEKLKKYIEEHNGEYPTKDENELFNFVRLLRNIYKECSIQKDGALVNEKGKVIISNDKMDKLNEINFIWNTNDYIFKRNVLLLKEYLDEYKKYPKKNEEYKGVQLGSWVDFKRAIYKNGIKREDGSIYYKRNILTKKQIELLDSINFDWFSDDRKVYKMIITENNQYQIKREILLKLKDILLVVKDTNDVEDELIKQISGEKHTR